MIHQFRLLFSSVINIQWELHNFVIHSLSFSNLSLELPFTLTHPKPPESPVSSRPPSAVPPSDTPANSQVAAVDTNLIQLDTEYVSISSLLCACYAWFCFHGRQQLHHHTSSYKQFNWNSDSVMTNLLITTLNRVCFCPLIKPYTQSIWLIPCYQSYGPTWSSINLYENESTSICSSWNSHALNE